MTHAIAAERVRRVVRELAALRKAAGISQYRLAKMTGLSREAVRLIEGGERSPTLHSLFLISEALDARLGGLVEEAESE